MLTLGVTTGFGWVIDSFKIQPEYYNIQAVNGFPVEISPL